MNKKRFGIVATVRNEFFFRNSFTLEIYNYKNEFVSFSSDGEGTVML
jgi:hypothetical protein